MNAGALRSIGWKRLELRRHSPLELGIQCVEELIGRFPFLFFADQDREILCHVSGLN